MRSSVKFIEQLGARVDEAWRAAGYAAAAFPELTRAALASSIAGAPTGDELAAWALSVAELPAQANATMSFGQPPVTLLRTDRFYIEALFWLDGTTAIHDHAFAGAFAVLAGSSVHTQFEFDEHRYVDARFRLGELRRQRCELLETGAVRAIEAGRGFIHSLFHLDRPSLSLTVRTYADAQAYPQLEYRYPGVAMDSSFAPEAPGRRLAVLHMLADTEHAAFESRLVGLVGAADLLQQFRALEQTAMHPWARQHLEAGYAAVDAEIAPVLRAAVNETLRQRNINGRRAALRDPEHRFLLALLQHPLDREELLALVAERTHHRDPIAQVVDWLAAISGVDTIGLNLDAAGLATVEGLLRGWSETEICERKQVAPNLVAKWGLTLPRTLLLGRLLH